MLWNLNIDTALNVGKRHTVVGPPQCGFIWDGLPLCLCRLGSRWRMVDHTTTKTVTKTVILKSAHQLTQTDVNAVQQTKPNQETIEISAVDLAPFR